LVKLAIDSNKDALFASVFMVIGTPYFSYISSRTEEAVTGKTYPFHFWTFLKEIKRGIVLSVRNSFKQLGWLLLISLVAFIPIIGLIAPLLTFIVQAYYYGLLMTDYTLERQGFSVKESQVYYRQHKPELFGIGLGLMFLLLIPVIGWFLAPTYALVAAYLNFEKSKAKENTV
jgi:CysZ protein